MGAGAAVAGRAPPRRRGWELRLGIGCVAILYRDRDLAWFAILSAPVYAAFAWRTAYVLGKQKKASIPKSRRTA